MPTARQLRASGFTSRASVTRPANTTAYTAGDVVGAAAAAITFSGIPPAQDFSIVGAELEIDVAAVPVGMTTFRLYLYSVTPPSALADNAAFDLPSGDRASFLGYVDLGTPVDLGSTLYVRSDSLSVDLKSVTDTVYGYLVTAGGFTPAGNSEVYVVTLRGVGI